MRSSLQVGKCHIIRLMAPQPKHEPTNASCSADSARRPAIDIHFGDNLEIMRGFESGSFDLIYIDPPFNTGRIQSRTRI